eukprot:GILI01025354.1.p1 GENE.GILI01025354.1~~GILI01025354.1.p1  ORF type:complete len:202 (+),score=35.54 GILI01025354.1:73-606(+)
MAFAFPDFYQMPPFFTVQPVLSTREKQLQLWGELVLSFTLHHKLYTLVVDEAANSPLFNNSQIQRRLNVEGIRAVIDHLVSQGRAEWESAEKKRCLVYWRPLEEWANLLYKWVCDSGKVNSVETVFSLREGDETQGTEFHGIPSEIFSGLLRVLERRGKAQVFKGTSTDEDGVKFFT